GAADVLLPACPTSRASVTGSPLRAAPDSTRPTASLGEDSAPAGIALVGSWVTRTSAAASLWPADKSRLVTTAGARGSCALVAGCAANTAAAASSSSANARRAKPTVKNDL